MIIQDPVVITSARSCFRCAAEFRTHGQQRLCSECRKPQTAEGRRGRRGAELTIREKQIVNLVRTGRPNKIIAHEVHLTEGTIKEYLNRIYRKLELSNRTELAVWSCQNPEGQPHT